MAPAHVPLLSALLVLARCVAAAPLLMGVTALGLPRRRLAVGVVRPWPCEYRFALRRCARSFSLSCSSCDGRGCGVWQRLLRRGFPSYFLFFRVPVVYAWCLDSHLTVASCFESVGCRGGVRRALLPQMQKPFFPLPSRSVAFLSRLLSPSVAHHCTSTPVAGAPPRPRRRAYG